MESKLFIDKALEHKIGYIPFIAALYSVCLVLSNITSGKLVAISATLIIDGGFLFFPITYIINDIITEVYGYKVCRKIIWAGFFTSIFAALGIWLVMIMPASPEWHHQEAFTTTFMLSSRIFIASISSCFLGEMINSLLLSGLKIYTRGRYLAARFILSSIFGAAIENALFYILAFYGVISWPVLLQMMLLQYILKLTYEIVLLPVSCALATWLKKREKIDHYDRLADLASFLPAQPANTSHNKK